MCSSMEVKIQLQKFRVRNLKNSEIEVQFNLVVSLFIIFYVNIFHRSLAWNASGVK